MRRLFIVAVFAACAAGCERDVVRLGAPGDAPSQLASALLVRELGARKQALHRELCDSTRSCLARLRSGDLDIAVIAVNEVGDGTRIVALSGVVRRPRVAIASDVAMITDISSFAELRRGWRIAVERSFAQRADAGLSHLIRTYHLADVERVFIDPPHERLAALGDGLVDAIVIDEGAVVGDVLLLADPRKALEPGELAYVIASDGGPADADVLRRAGEAIAARAGALDLDRAIAEIVGGVAPLEAISSIEAGSESAPAPLRLALRSPRDETATLGANAVARSLARRQVVLIESADPVATLTAGGAELAVTTLNRGGPGIEAVAVFDRGSGAAATLWQRVAAAKLEYSDAERVLAASAFARLPDRETPSIWSRARRVTRNGRVAAVDSQWLDSIVNVLACAFLAWLVVSIFRRRRIPVLEDPEA